RRRADDRARAGARRACDRYHHAAVLEAAGRVRSLALQVQLEPERLGEARRMDERRRALAERQGRSERAHAHPSSVTPRSETTGSGSDLSCTSGSSPSAPSASESAPARASWVTTWRAAPEPFGCWTSRAIEISRSASASATRARVPGRSSTERRK